MYKFLIGSTLQKKQKELKGFVTHFQQTSDRWLKNL